MITHAVITGMSRSGKSTMAKAICASMGNKKMPVLVFDPIMEGYAAKGLNGWPKNAFVIGDWDKFKAVFWASRSCFCVIDECADVVEEDPRGLRRMMRRGRHIDGKGCGGHVIFLIAQRYLLSLDKSARDQASHVYVFSQSADDAQAIAKDFNAPHFVHEVPKLPRYSYICTDKYGNEFHGITKK